MNNDNIYMDLPAVESKIETLKAQRDEMNTALEKIKGDISKMPELWNGNSGDEIYAFLNEYSTSFPSIIEKLDEFIAELQRAKEAYQKLDDDITSKMEENAKVSAT